MLAVTALVVALTFGLSRAQDANDPCPADSCPGVCCYTSPPPTGCTPPPSGCMTGTWNQSSCMCEGGTYVPPTTGGCTMPPNGCMTGTWNQATCMCEGGTYTPPTGTTCPTDRPIKCPDGRCEVTQLSCTSGTPTTGTCTAPMSGCGMNSFWDLASCMCRPSTTTGGITPVSCADQRGTWCAGTNSGSGWCKFDGGACPTTTTYPTTTGTCTGTPPACTNGQSLFCNTSVAAPVWTCQSLTQTTQPPYTQDNNMTRPVAPGMGMDQQGQQFGQPGMPNGQNFNPGMNQQPMYQPPMYGIFGPQQPMMGGQGQNGPQNEEQMQKQQADQEAQFKKMQEQQVKQIKKELGRMKKEIDRVRKQLDKVTVTDSTPEEIVTAKEALAEVDAAMADVETCSGDECFDIMPTVGPLMQDIMNPDVMNALQRLKEGPKFAKKITTEVNRIVKKTTSTANSLTKKAKKIKDADLRDAVTAEIAAVTEQCSTLGTEILDVAKGGDIETAADSLQNELNDACGAINDLTWKVDGFLNKQQVVKSMDREIKSLTRQLATFQKNIKRGKFNGDLDAVSQLAVTIPDISASLAEIKAEKDIDMLGDLLDEAAGLISDAEGYIQDAQIQNMADQFDMFQTQTSGPAPSGEYIKESNPSPAP